MSSKVVINLVLQDLPFLKSCWRSSGVSRISFWGGGGSKYFWKNGGICMTLRAMQRFLGGFGGMVPRENF